MRHVPTTLLAVLVVAGLAMPAGAQPAPNAGGDARMAHMNHAGPDAHHLERLAMTAQQRKGIVAFYRAELAITPAQEPQWAAFASVLGDALVANHANAVAASAAATAPARMDANIAALTAELETAKALAGTGKALYAVLTPEQRVLADGFWTRQMPGAMP